MPITDNSQPTIHRYHHHLMLPPPSTPTTMGMNVTAVNQGVTRELPGGPGCRVTSGVSTPNTTICLLTTTTMMKPTMTRLMQARTALTTGNNENSGTHNHEEGYQGDSREDGTTNSPRTCQQHANNNKNDGAGDERHQQRTNRTRKRMTMLTTRTITAQAQTAKRESQGQQDS
jgi:hypothetical protein